MTDKVSIDVLLQFLVRSRYNYFNNSELGGYPIFNKNFLFFKEYL